jgi:DNA-binding IclR family transcriptional regulator
MTVQSVEKAIEILFAFTENEPILGISDLSTKLDINRSTVHHLVQSLLPSGLIEQDPHSRKYRLGIRTIELGGRMLRSRNLSVVCQPYLHHVADQLRETTYLGVLDNGESLNIEQACGPHLVQHCGWQGRRTPFYCTSSGKVLVAYLSEEEQDQLISQSILRTYTPHTITDPKILLDELKQVRQQGFAISLGELEDHNNAVSVPIIISQSRQVVASLGVVGPDYRFTESHCRDAVHFLKSVALEISSRLQASDFAIHAYYRHIQSISP